ncbi:hypothetical protein LJR153_002174 [Paenibacillus sp. LjRoot153]|uniref:hypothetical protein n=1 Tax=Paenibacillus sp. LjRoot153 TaxID=3342270 RepID=UPI003ECF0A07
MGLSKDRVEKRVFGTKVEVDSKGMIIRDYALYVLLNIVQKNMHIDLKNNAFMEFNVGGKTHSKLPVRDADMRGVRAGSFYPNGGSCTTMMNPIINYLRISRDEQLGKHLALILSDQGQHDGLDAYVPIPEGEHIHLKATMNFDKIQFFLSYR